MVKSIIIDDYANQSLNNLLSSNESNHQVSKTGLLIGSRDQNKDFITSIIPTPINSSSINQSNDQVDSDWIINHAILVHDMLIGGSDILGIYSIDQPVSICKQILIKLFKILNEFDYYKQMKFNSERLVFLADSKTKNINMKCLDFLTQSQDQKQFQTCEIKIQKNLFQNEFKRLSSNINLNSTFKTPNVKSNSLLRQDFLNAISTQDYFNEDKFVCLINNYIIDENKQFSDISQLNSEKNSNEFSATLMENLNVESNEKILSQENLESIYELTGVSNLVVQFHKTFKLSYIKKLLIYDLMRSFNARVRLLVEDLDAEKDIIGDVQLEEPNSNDASSIEESYQTPNRIQIDLVNESNLLICDYVFPDETYDDIKERVKELFSLDITDTSKQIIYLEDLPPEIKMCQSDDPETTGGSNSNVGSTSNLCSSKNVNLNKGVLNKGALYVGSFLVAAASVFITYYSYIAAKFLNDDNEA